jgi:cephalosporin hydroxylase
MGRPIIQEPEDAFRMQEVICSIKPDVIIETGVAHGGSLVFYASLCKAMGSGRIVGVDIEIRPHNRTAIEAHELFDLITLIEGDSTGDDVVSQVRSLIKPGEKVLVIFDSCHDYEHVMRELAAYADMVTPGSFAVVTDGSQEYLGSTPRAQAEYPACTGWGENNPKRAAEDFAAADSRFEIVEPEWFFNESPLSKPITHWPKAYLKRVR